jgi:hypothetical protein
VYWDARVRNHATHALEGTIRQLGCSKSVPASGRGLLESPYSSCKSPYLWRAAERTRTADLTLSRVIHQALQGFAQGCKYRIPKPVSFLRLAPTEICPGNDVFYDAMQFGLAIVPLNHCALRVLATVVSVATRYL